jgi:signal peptidase I
MERKKRYPIIAAVLSLVTPGLGQLYNGQLKKGIIFFGAGFVLPVLLFLIGIQRQFPGLIALILFMTCLWVFIIGEAFFTALRKKEVVLKPYNKWYVYILIILLISGTYMIPWGDIAYKIFRFSPFKIATGAMEPALESGDYLIADLKYFKENEIQRGDLVVFKFPQDPSKDFVKRIIAMEGEKIEIRDKQVYINDEPISGEFKIPKDDKIESKPEDEFYYYDISKRNSFGPEIVPAGYCFVLGDNRANSYDSRYWGFLPLSHIKGKSLYVYWSKDKSRIGLKIK